MNKIMRSLGIVLSMITLAALPGRGQDIANASGFAARMTPGAAIKLVDPHPNLPPQLLPRNINDVGEIVGHIGDEHDGTGFIRSRGGQYTEFLFPRQCGDFVTPCSYPMGINDRGEIVGVSQSEIPGAFLREKDGSFKTLPAAPGNSLAQPNSINNQGEIVGWYSSAPGVTHGFLLRGGEYTTIDFPGTTNTQCTGINNSGMITGFYVENSGVHGFLWWQGNFIATFQVSDSTGANNTFPMAVNNWGQVSGDFGSFPTEGAFVRNFDGTIRILDLAALLQPIGGSFGLLTGINNRGDLVGSFGPGLHETFGDIFGFVIPRGAGEPW
ncbi:MAG: hypothetical protein ACXVJL_10185 [Candidatus Angelobacter sp.]